MKCKITESGLRKMIRESIKSALNENGEEEEPYGYESWEEYCGDYDTGVPEDNFSYEDNYPNLHSDNQMDWFYSERKGGGNMDDPAKRDEIDSIMSKDPYYQKFDSLKDAQNDYSWYRFRNSNDNIVNHPFNQDQMRHSSHSPQWSDRELSNRNYYMNKWIKNGSTPDVVGQGWDSIHINGY